MRLDSKVLGLPASIIVLITSHLDTAATDDNQSPAQWPYNLPPHVRYWPEDPPHRRRDLEAIRENVRLGRSPVGVMKMSDEEGEKFYMEYWQFEGDWEQSSLLDIALDSPLPTADDVEDRLLANVSTPISYRPPFALHTENELNHQGRAARGATPAGNAAAAALAVLEKRGFACPGGTSNCSSIGYPNSCCGTEDTCFVIEDTGLGPVGCCPTGSTCAGIITTCNAPNSPCPDILGGGCCIPNYVCAGVGCVISSTQTSTQTSTIVTVLLTSTTTDTFTGLQTTLACASNFHACPVNLGGGCCSAGRVCASSSICLPASSTETTATSTLAVTTTVTTATGVPPVRVTSESSVGTSTTTSAVTSCPTGFYACEAYYAGGCCRTGRNCDTTSCPVISSTTIISSGVTVVVPVGAAATVTSPTGNCASGWFSCAPSDGGNCCPNGYQCGTVSCTSVEATATLSSQKESPNAGAAAIGMRDSVTAFIGAMMIALALI